MDIKTIQIVLSIVLGVILIAPVFMGIVRGWKKSAFRLAWVVVFGIISFFVVGAISSAIVNMDLTSFNITIEGELITSVPQYAEIMLSTSSPEMAQLVAENAQILTLAVSLIAAVINLILVVVFYWFTKWILWPIWALIAHFIFKKKKVETTKVLQQGKVIAEKHNVVKEKKHRWAGALFGLAMGIFSVGITIIPLAGISDTAMRIEAATLVEQSDGSTKGLLTQNLGENADMLYIYTDSAAGKVLGAVGVNAFSTAVAKTVATTGSGDQKISALDGVVDIASISLKVQDLSNVDVTTLDQQGWTKTLTAVKEVADKAMSSGLVGGLYDSVVPYIINGMLTDPNFFVPMPDFNNQIIEETFNDLMIQFKTIQFSQLKADLLKIIDIMQEINNIDLLTELMKDEIVIENLQAKLTTEFGQKVNDIVFEMNTICELLPLVFESSFEILCSQLEVEYVDVEGDLTIEQIKNLSGAWIKNIIAIVKQYDQTKDMPFAYSTFENFGDFVDAAKQSGIIHEQTFNNLVDYVADFVMDELSEQNLKQSVELLLEDMLGSIKLIPSFKNELKQIGLMLETAELEQLDFDNFELEPAAKVLDKIIPTFIYQHNKGRVIDTIVDLLDDYCIENSLDIDTQTLSTVCNQINNVYSFQMEYLKAKDLIEFVETFNFETDLDDQTKMQTLGGHLDATITNGSILLNGENCKLILQSVIKNIDLPANINTIVVDGKNIKVAMADNVSKITTYQTEFAYVAKIVGIQNNATLSQFGKALDGVKHSVLLDGILNKVVEQKIDDNTQNLTDNDLIVVVEKVKQNVANVESFETEFDYMQQFADFDAQNATMTQFGTMLDQFVDSALFENTTNDLLTYALKKGKDQIETIYVDIYNKILDNVANINGKIYQSELNYIQSFVDFTNNGEPKTLQNIQEYLDQNILDQSGNSSSVLLDNQIVDQILALAA